MHCKKDTYDLIMQTMGGTMNDGIQSVLLADGKTARDIIINTADGSVKIRDNENATVANNQTNIIQPRFRITGDLAFYSLILGKPSMDNKWCTWCTFFCAQDWEWDSDSDAEKWTKQKLSMMLARIQSGEIMNARQRCGVKTEVIIDVDPSIVVIPPLHLKLGLFNRAIIQPKGNSFWSWMEQRIEMISQDEINVRDQLLQYTEEHKGSNDTLKLWDMFHKNEMEEKLENIRYLREELKYPLRSRRHSPEERTIMELEVPDLDESYKGLKRERDELEKDLKDKYKLVVTFKK